MWGLVAPGQVGFPGPRIEPASPVLAGVSFTTEPPAKPLCWFSGFPGRASGKEPTCQFGRLKKCRFNPWAGKSPRRRARQLTPVSCLENHMDRGVWRAMVRRGTERQTWLKRLGLHTQTVPYSFSLGEDRFSIICIHDFHYWERNGLNSKVDEQLLWKDNSGFMTHLNPRLFTWPCNLKDLYICKNHFFLGIHPNHLISYALRSNTYGTILKLPW